MVRIRKPRLAITSSSGKPELIHECSNGTGRLHLHAGSKSNPSFQDLRSSLLSPAPTIIKQDHLLLAGSGYSATHRHSQKQQLPAKAVSDVKRKPYIVVSSSGVEHSWEDGQALMMKKGEGNPRAKSVMDVAQHHEVKHMHMHDGDDDVESMDMKGSKELGLSGTSGEGDKLAETGPDIACKGSALIVEESNVHAHPAMVVASDYSRKVRPLQLILSSDYSATVPNLPLPMCPASSRSTVLGMPSPPLPKLDKDSPYVLIKAPPLPSSSCDADPLIKQIADVKSRDEMRPARHEDASGCNSAANREENRAEFKSCGLLEGWQGHRRPRSYIVQGGRGFNASMAGAGVSAVMKKESVHLTGQKRKKPKQAKRKAIDICISVLPPPCTTTSPASAAADHGDMRQQECPAAATKNKAHAKKMPAGCLLPISFIAAGSLDAKPATTTTQLDSMRCRRKDGRRWQCKEQVVKPGAPFCHYHTLKMREKHAASVIRNLSKRLQGEVKFGSLSYADLRNVKRANKRRSPSSTTAAGQDGYGRGAAEDKEEEEDYDNDDELLQQKMHAKVGKQQTLLESLMLRRRWRKKCKPCIRRLHDIQDRARPAAMDGLEFFNPCVEDTSNLNKKDSPPVRSLPECLLNTDPYEWRSDFP